MDGKAIGMGSRRGRGVHSGVGTVGPGRLLPGKHAIGGRRLISMIGRFNHGAFLFLGADKIGFRKRAECPQGRRSKDESPEIRQSRGHGRIDLPQRSFRFTQPEGQVRSV